MNLPERLLRECVIEKSRLAGGKVKIEPQMGTLYTVPTLYREIADRFFEDVQAVKAEMLYAACPDVQPLVGALSYMTGLPIADIPDEILCSRKDILSGLSRCFFSDQRLAVVLPYVLNVSLVLDVVNNLHKLGFQVSAHFLCDATECRMENELSKIGCSYSSIVKESDFARIVAVTV
jgi:hypothetical protein